MAVGSKLHITIGGGGTVSALHHSSNQLTAAVVGPDPSDDTPTVAEVFWNEGPYITVKGVPNSRHLVTTIPSSAGPACDGSDPPAVT